MEKLEIIENLENALKNIEKEYNSICVDNLKISNNNIERIELEKNRITEELKLLEDEAKKATIFTKIGLKFKIIDKKSNLKSLELSLKEEKDKFLLENKTIIEEYNKKEILNIKDKINIVNSKKFLCAKDFIFVEGGKYKFSIYEWNFFPYIEVEVFDLEVCKYPITQKIWTEIMGNNPSKFKGDNRPVETVSWWQALEFCNKLSEKYGLEPVYDLSKIEEGILKINELNGRTVDANAPSLKNTEGFRLPTELEWEWFARGGQKAIDEGTFNYKYSGSDNFDEVGWYGENSGGETYKCNDYEFYRGGSTKDVGLKKANQLGLYDCCGNVHEWCFDSVDYRTVSEEEKVIKKIGRTIEEVGGRGSYNFFHKYRKLRGGHWSCSGQNLYGVYGGYNSKPTDINEFSGFRVVRTVQI